ncbi:MAG TPA: LLM class flavin-dependent oxidoreductase, partial [Acidimicrobiia bacterium]|nr:LLM class flavin-dependent oxidoreductase [Acidimicrobiia bacterium]
RYLEQLRGLLRGEVVEIDGERCQMIHHPDWASARPIETPLLVSALGPKGKGLVKEMFDAGTIDGYIGMADVDVDVPNRVLMTAGTVLDDGEAVTSERVAAALGPWYVVRYHGVWQAFPDALAGMPGGKAWLAGINAERPEGERHLAVHEGHITDVMPHDEDVLALAGDALATTGWVGTADEIHQKAVDLAAAGGTDLMFTPAGDFPREMRAWLQAVRG